MTIKFYGPCTNVLCSLTLILISKSTVYITIRDVEASVCELLRLSPLSLLLRPLDESSQVKFILPNAKSTQKGISEKTMRSSWSTAPIAILNCNRRKLKLGNKL